MKVDPRISAELLAAGDRARILEIDEEARKFADRGRAAKKNYAQRFSTALAQKIADALRSRFPGIVPHADGKGHESLARTERGLKRLDVNYSNTQLGLGLGISVKTLNFKDPRSGRYTKNMVRIDNELRAEAAGYHTRQPYSVLVGLVFLPADATDDSARRSSFRHAWDTFRRRAGRTDPNKPADRFEKLFLALYAIEPERFGHVDFFDVDGDVPPSGRPPNPLSLSDVLSIVVKTFEDRNP